MGSESNKESAKDQLEKMKNTRRFDGSKRKRSPIDTPVSPSSLSIPTPSAVEVNPSTGTAGGYDVDKSSRTEESSDSPREKGGTVPTGGQ